MDLETTGLHPSVDRVVEVAVVRLDHRARRIDEWTTLVNPRRDVGPTRIHGISAGAAALAPTFEDIAPELLWRLGGHVVVAHNASFDWSFLTHEFARLGVPVGDETSALCTMRSCSRHGLAGGRSLQACCWDLGVPHGEAHTALGDARATAGLLAAILARVGRPGQEEPSPVAPRPCPERPAPIRLRTDPRPARAPSVLGSLADRVAVPSVNGAPRDAAEAYCALLDRVLEDRRVDQSEVEAIAALADEWGLSMDSLALLHVAYMHGMWTLARADGVVTSAELDDLAAVADLLGVPMGDGSTSSAPAPAVMAPAPGGMTGLSVCFTGESVCSVRGVDLERCDQERIAAERGMVVKTGVSRKLDVLVLADPDSQSGKAVKARELGVRMMTEPAFWRVLGVEID